MSNEIGQRTSSAPDGTTGSCPDCGGEGFVIGHEDECYEDGCVCSGVEVECSCQREPLRDQEIEF